MNIPYKTIIIDDEALARDGLLQLLSNFTDTFEVISMAKNGTEAKKQLEELKPDLIFLDIEMPGCSGFELLEKLDIIPIVIFCTAYDQYSLQAFETNSIDYLVKPVEKERIEKTVQKLKTFNRNNSSQHILNFIKEVSLLKEEKKMTSITVKKGAKLIFIKLKDISHFEADSNYVNIFSELEIT